MYLGSFGDLIFEVSHFKVLTFNNFKHDSKAKYAEHEIIGKAPKLEFLHRELENISFDMLFHSELGVNPEDEVQKLRDMCEAGEAHYFILGNRVYGDVEFVIESVSESAEYVNNFGEIIACKVSVKLEEYVR